MCVVSMIGQNYQDRFPGIYPTFPNVTREEFDKLKREEFDKLKREEFDKLKREELDKLKRELEELKKLLKAAKEFDEAAGQKECENADKVKFIKQVAEFVGVDIEIV